MAHLRGKQQQGGFTIVELLIVIVVIGILAAITIVAYNGVQERARTAMLQSELGGAARYIEGVNAENGSYPASLNDLKKSNQIMYQYASTSTSYCLSVNYLGTSTWYHVANGESPSAGACTGAGALWMAKAPAVGTQIAPPGGSWTNGVTIAAIYDAPAAQVNIIGASSDMWIKIEGRVSGAGQGALIGNGTAWQIANTVVSSSRNRLIVSGSATEGRAIINGSQYQTTTTRPTITLPMRIYSVPVAAAVWPNAMTASEQQAALAWLEQYANN